MKKKERKSSCCLFNEEKWSEDVEVWQCVWYVEKEIRGIYVCMRVSGERWKSKKAPEDTMFPHDCLKNLIFPYVATKGSSDLTN